MWRVISGTAGQYGFRQRPTGGRIVIHLPIHVIATKGELPKWPIPRRKCDRCRGEPFHPGETHSATVSSRFGGVMRRPARGRKVAGLRE